MPVKSTFFASFVVDCHRSIPPATVHYDEDNISRRSRFSSFKGSAPVETVIDVVNRVLPPNGRYSGRNGADTKSAAILAARWQHPVNNVYSSS